MTGPAFNRLDPDKQRRQLEPFDKAPNHANAMVIRNEFIKTNRAQSNLPSLRRAKPRRRRVLALRRGLTRQVVEKFLTFEPLAKLRRREEFSA
jgi:hypothetical protein